MSDHDEPARSLQALRTVDVARRAGYSVQQIRDLERDGALPRAHRTASGYRVFGDEHVRSARAYRVLTAAIGPVEARRVMAAVHRDRSAALAMIDEAHARLDRERRGLALATDAARSIAREPIADPRGEDAMSVGELAEALGVRPSTLRHWDTTGLVVPGRTGPSRVRRYSPADVRDARIVHQLRLAGWRIPPLAELMPRLRDARGDVLAALTERIATVDDCSAGLLEAGGLIARLLRPRP